LKSEFVNLAVIAELPLVIVNVQRGGPSTGLPTKSEQADLLQSIWGRNGESPLVVIAAASPADCFYATIEAAHYAVKYMTPVIVLTDGYLANGAEPLRIPEASELPDINPRRNDRPLKHNDVYLPYMRDPYTHARPWVIPGTPGYEHRTGGLEKEEFTGAVSYVPENHEKMVRIRHDKIEQVVNDYAPLKIHGDDDAELLVIGWGSTYGAIRKAVNNMRKRGAKVACLHLRNIHPSPKELPEILSKHKKLLVVENNLGQLNLKLKAEYLITTELLTKVQGQPFRIGEVEAKIEQLIGEV
jgi:2-oxoglutarate ferredoxin oxidoreductase subunit alpha